MKKLIILSDLWGKGRSDWINRYEDKRPECTLNLFYAGNDKYIPIDDWFRKLNIEMNVYPEEEHTFYINKRIAIEVSNKIILNK